MELEKMELYASLKCKANMTKLEFELNLMAPSSTPITIMLPLFIPSLIISLHTSKNVMTYPLSIARRVLNEI